MLKCFLKYAHPTRRRKDSMDGDCVSRKNSPMLPGGSIPPAINEAYWKNVDMKLALPMPVKKDT